LGCRKHRRSGTKAQADEVRRVARRSVTRNGERRHIPLPMTFSGDTPSQMNPREMKAQIEIILGSADSREISRLLQKMK
jgi:hypothetical protein